MVNLSTQFNLTNDFSIQTLNEELHETIALLKRIGVDSKDLEKVHQQLYVLNLFVDRQIVSVAGLQSVGKTSLIKRYLELDEDLLESEVGVGEKRPVLISADESIDSTEYYVMRTQSTNKGYAKAYLQEISKEELNKGVLNPSLDTLWYEIKIPKKDKLGNLTLALLPGFERNKRSDSQLFLNLFLNSSTGMILVLNHLRLAQASQHELLDKISKVYKEKTPCFVLTFADDIKDEGKRTTIKQDLMKQFAMDNEEQILFSDLSDDSISFKLEKLIKQNSQYTTDSANLHIQQQLLISEQLSLYLSTVEQEIRMKFLKDEEDSDLKFSQRKLSRFKAEYLEIVREKLQLQMNIHIAACEKRIENDLENEKSTFGQKIKALFKSELTYSERQELKKWVEDIFLGEDPYKTNTIVLDAIGEASESYLDKRLPGLVDLVESSKKRRTDIPIESPHLNNRQFPLSTSNSNKFGTFKADNTHSEFDKRVEGFSKKEQLNLVLDATIETLDKFMSKDTELKGLDEAELQVIPALAGGITQQTIATKLFMEKNGFKNLHDLNKFKMEQEGIELVKKEMNQLSMDMDQIVKGSLVFFGIDSLDGTINSFGAITGALRALGLGATAATGVAVGSTGVLAASIALKKGSDKIEKHKLERDSYAKNLIRVSTEYQIESAIKSIEKIFNDIEFKLEMAKKQYENAHKDVPVYNELEIRIRRLQKECGRLREQAYRNETFIGKLSKTEI